MRTAFERNKVRPASSTVPDPVERIDALTRTARNTWFALLGLLVFVGITLMGVEHIDFYGVDRATKLPLVNIDVPPAFFFIAAPILTSAFYIYFHLHLIRLWDALGAAPALVGGRPLGDAVLPWLVTDAALTLRQRLRRDGCATARALDAPSTLLNIALIWGLGLLVLGFLWAMSMTARTFWMTAIACAASVAAGYAGLWSGRMLVVRLGTGRGRLSSWPSTRLIMLLAAAMLVALSYLRTEGPPDRLAPIRMLGLPVVEKPAGWLPHEIARRDFFAEWCRREETDCDLDALSVALRFEFDEEWRMRRGAAVSALRKPDWHHFGRVKPDFRKALLQRSFLAGANLQSAQLTGADLGGAQMEGADLSGAQLQGARLFGAQMQGADLSGAQMQGANLSFTLLTGEPDEPQRPFEIVFSGDQPLKTLASTFLGAVENQGGALRAIDLTVAEFDPATDFRNAFLDASVTVTDAFRAQMGNPCQWAAEVLGDEEFFGRWRGWIEAGSMDHGGIQTPFGSVKLSVQWEVIAPSEWRDVGPIPPPEGCAWKTGPMPGAGGGQP